MQNIPYKHLNVIVMPTDYCNMNCVYCFNSRKSALEKRKMSIDTVEKLYSITIPYYSHVHFLWHGGEPMSMGIDFYKQVLELQKKYADDIHVVTNSIQTNLTLMTKEFADFFVENNIHVGSSFDGTQNALTRKKSDGILKGYNILKDSGGKNGFICVVQKTNVNHLIEDYEWFKKNGINYTLNYYLTNNPNGDPLFVEKEKMISAINDFFDYWVNDKECNIHISYFDTFILYLVNKYKDLCCYNSCIGKHIGIRFNGDIYGCNRDFPIEYSFGNIKNYSNIHECFDSEGFTFYLKAAISRRAKCKESCDIYGLCEGGCNSTALAAHSIEEPNSYFCDVLKGVYEHIESYINCLDKTTLNSLNPYFSKLIKK